MEEVHARDEGREYKGHMQPRGLPQKTRVTGLTAGSPTTQLIPPVLAVDNWGRIRFWEGLVACEGGGTPVTAVVVARAVD